MMKRLSLIVFVLGGCLPAYDNHIGQKPADLAGADLAGDMAAPPLACSGISGSTLSRGLVSMEEIVGGNGPVVRLEGCEGAGPAPGVSAMTTGQTAKVPLPQTYLDAGAERFVIIEGTYTAGTASGNILRSWIAPRVKITKDENALLHFTADAMISVRAQIAKDLVALSKIPSGKATDATEFGKHFDFAYGFIGLRTVGAPEEAAVLGHKWSVDDDADSDKSTCDPTMKCCVYYANGFDAVFRKPPVKSTIIDAAKTNADTGYFAVVCPNEGTGKTSVKLTQTSTSLLDEVGAPLDGALAAKFVPFELPLRHGEATLVQYFPFK